MRPMQTRTYWTIILTGIVVASLMQPLYQGVALVLTAAIVLTADKLLHAIASAALALHWPVRRQCRGKSGLGIRRVHNSGEQCRSHAAGIASTTAPQFLHGGPAL